MDNLIELLSHLDAEIHNLSRAPLMTKAIAAENTLGAARRLLGALVQRVEQLEKERQR